MLFVVFWRLAGSLKPWQIEMQPRKACFLPIFEYILGMSFLIQSLQIQNAALEAYEFVRSIRSLCNLFGRDIYEAFPVEYFTSPILRRFSTYSSRG